VRNALVYMLQNRLKHCPRRHSRGRGCSDVLAARSAFFRATVSRLRWVASSWFSQHGPSVCRTGKKLAAHGRLASPRANSDRRDAEDLTRECRRALARYRVS
jgi:hypothetical protein